MLASEVKKTQTTSKSTTTTTTIGCVFRPARPTDAAELVESYESVFGKDGIKENGHDPYPAPDVFSIEGINSILKDPHRDFLVAEMNGEVAGGMIVTQNSPYHREFGCVSVRKKFQGSGISSLMLAHQKKLEQQCALVINTTEIVTHSLLSQSAHNRAGYKHITGFGFCQYPRVFFRNHPESCLWITSLEGRVIEHLRHTSAVNAALHSADTTPSNSLNSEESQLMSWLRAGRDIYVPEEYFDVVTKIVAQFADVLNYRVHTAELFRSASKLLGAGVLKLDTCDDSPYAYLTFPDKPLEAPGKNFDEAWQTIDQTGKRYVQARVPINKFAAIAHLNLLRKRGFIFLGAAPLFGDNRNGNLFDDMLLMQWIAPHVLASCPLPGETDSVAKLYGYPMNLTGDIVRTMKYDLSNGVGKK